MTDLTDDQKRQLIERYLFQFSLDAYGHTMNRLTAIEQNDEKAIYAADLALYNIQVATITYQRELDILNGNEPDQYSLPEIPVDPTSLSNDQTPILDQPE